MECSVRYWLVKSEPGAYSIHDLERDGQTHWDGVRNYQARNLMRDMKVGDRVLFYHSNADPPGVAGVARVVKEAYPDPSALDPGSPYFDAKSDPSKPRWDMVDLVHERTLAEVVPLARLRKERSLAGMPLLQTGQRLSVQPVEKKHFECILALAV